jgi:site-specific recombinase XerD
MATPAVPSAVHHLLDEFCKWATQERGRQMSSYTANRYRRYVEFFTEAHGHPVTATKREFTRWRDGISGESPQTINVKIAALRAFFDFAVERGLRKDNPAKAMAMQKVPNRQPRFISRPLMERLFEAVYDQPNLQDRALLEVLYGSGLRRDEAATLRLENIIERDKLQVVGKGTVTRMTIITEPEFRALRDHCLDKMGDDRTAEIISSISVDAAFDDLRRRRPDAPIFYNAEGKPLTEVADGGNFVWKRVGHYAKQMGEKLVPHQFRHSFATHLLSEGIDIFKVSKFLGHKDIKTTVIYLGLEDRVFTEVQQAHPRSRSLPEWSKRSAA